MLSAIAAVLVGIWFYYTANRTGRSPVSWAISGVVVYALAAIIWSLSVTPFVKDTAVHTQSGLLIFVVRYAYIVIGILAAVFVNNLLNKKISD